MSSDLHPWAETLSALHDQVWTRLIRGVHDRRAAARHPTLATVSADGTPQARTIVLRAADRCAASLRFYTDRQSAKVAELRAQPKASLHIWDNSAHLQMRLLADVSFVMDEDVTAIWASLPEVARHSYGSTPAPGQPLRDALDYQKTPDPAAFIVGVLALQEMDILHLGPQHRRARFSRAKGWQGVWCAP